jgi:predicted HTH domain antitoxin
MSLVSFSIPDEISVSEFEIKMIVAAKLFEEGKISSGQAADIVGLSKRAFLEIVGKYGVSIFGYDYDELTEDLKHV